MPVPLTEDANRIFAGLRLRMVGGLFPDAYGVARGNLWHQYGSGAETTKEEEEDNEKTKHEENEMNPEQKKSLGGEHLGAIKVLSEYGSGDLSMELRGRMTRASNPYSSSGALETEEEVPLPPETAFRWEFGRPCYGRVPPGTECGVICGNGMAAGGRQVILAHRVADPETVVYSPGGSGGGAGASSKTDEVVHVNVEGNYNRAVLDIDIEAGRKKVSVPDALRDLFFPGSPKRPRYIFFCCTPESRIYYSCERINYAR